MVCKLLSHGGEILIPDRLLEEYETVENKPLWIVTIIQNIFWYEPAGALQAEHKKNGSTRKCVGSVTVRGEPASGLRPISAPKEDSLGKAGAGRHSSLNRWVGDFDATGTAKGERLGGGTVHSTERTSERPLGISRS